MSLVLTIVVLWAFASGLTGYLGGLAGWKEDNLMVASVFSPIGLMLALGAIAGQSGSAAFERRKDRLERKDALLQARFEVDLAELEGQK